MILDSSAILAILLREPGWRQLATKLAQAAFAGAGAPTLAEVSIVLTAKLAFDARLLLEEFLRESGIEIIVFAPEHFRAAADAFYRYGKGRHPAALNFGDCLTYAAASVSGLPLLFKGSDFSRTDLRPA
jgi:ribonuclease VapC